MGVKGYELLKIAKMMGLTAVMLTAHAKSPENIIKSYKSGAASFIPKEKVNEIEVFLTDILEAERKGRDPWWWWTKRLWNFWKTEFGENWEHPNKEFFEKLKKL
jgi:hypothetical protein